MFIFPNHKPDTLSFIAPDVKELRSEFDAGTSQRIRTQFVAAGAQLAIGYSHHRAAAIAEIWNFYTFSVGKSFGFSLPSTIFSEHPGLVSTIANPLGGVVWIFESAPQVEVLIGSTVAGRSLYGMQINLRSELH